MDKPWLSHYEPHVPATLDYPKAPLANSLRENARRYPDRAATTFFGSRLTL